MKKRLAIIIIISMLVTSVNLQPVRVSANALSEVNVRFQVESRFSQYKEEQEVTVLIELKENSLLGKYNDEKAAPGRNRSGSNDIYESYGDYATSDRGEEERGSIERQQTVVLNQIEKIAGDDGVQVVRQYTDIANMLVVKVKAENLDDIAGLRDVKSISPSVTYNRPDEERAGGYTGTGSDLMYADQLEYKGDGILIAVLDTGCDVNHEAFQSDIVNPKLTKDSLGELLEQKEFIAETYEEHPATDAGSVYINQRIPFVYDYADGDCDVNPTEESVRAFGSDHGSHVAGIIGADGDRMKGIVPNAQMAIMKVFSDSSNFVNEEFVVFDALQDCLNLGADVINMSFGTMSGYTSDDACCIDILKKLEEAGVCLIISAGNSASAADGNAYGSHALSSNPDTGIVESNSTYVAALSIASYENSISISTALKLKDGTKIFIEDSVIGKSDKFSELAEKGEIEYAIVEGPGEETDYVSVDVKDKIAVVARGEIIFNEKVVNAASHGAIGVIVYNYEDENTTSKMQIDNPVIPSGMILYSDYVRLRDTEEKILTVLAEETFINKEAKEKMSAFSSWGCTPDLKLKPELTGVGGSVYSTVPFIKYASKSGTSMSAPQIAGISAAVLQYIEANRESKFASLDFTRVNKSRLSSQLLMSTANPVFTTGYTKEGQEISLPYSPRKQGAGLADAEEAIETYTYLYSDEEVERPRMNLGDDPGRIGSFNGSFHIKNLSAEAVTYDLMPYVMTETIGKAEDFDYIMEVPTGLDAETSITIQEGAEDVSLVGFTKSGDEYIIDDFNIESGVSGATITIGPNSDIRLSFSIKLTDDDKDYINRNFENGEFVEGFLVFNETGEGEKAGHLTIPFMGFYGDWTDAPIFDMTIYEYCDEENQSIPVYHGSERPFTGLMTSDSDGEEKSYMYLGLSISDDESCYDAAEKCIAFSPNGDGWHDELYWNHFTLRNARVIKYTIKDEDGTALYTQENEFYRKTSIFNNDFVSMNDLIEWSGTDENGEPLPNNTVVSLEIAAHIDYRLEDENSWETITLPIVIDNEAPMIKDIQVNQENHEVSITVTDNLYLAQMLFYNEAEDVNTPIVWNTEETGVEKTATFDYVEDCNSYELEVYDYAGNVLRVSLDVTDYKALLPEASPEPPTVDPWSPWVNPPSGNTSIYEPIVTQEPVITPEETPAPEQVPTEKPTGEPVDRDAEEQHVYSYKIGEKSSDYVKKAVLNTYLTKGKDLTLEYSKGDRVNYSWTFKAEDYQPGMKLSKIKTGVQIKSGEESAYDNGVEIACAQTGRLPIEAKLKIDLSDVYQPGQKLFLYIKGDNDKLLCVPNSKYKVDDEGYATLNIIQGGNYVLLNRVASSGQRTEILNQIKVSKKITLKAKNAKSITVKLPATLTKVSSIKKFDSKLSQTAYGAKITCKSSDTAVVRVSGEGRLTAKKAGKAVITVTVKLSNGKSKSFKTTVVVK